MCTVVVRCVFRLVSISDITQKRSKMVFVLSFVGDMVASQVGWLRSCVTLLIDIASQHDEVVIKLSRFVLTSLDFSSMFVLLYALVLWSCSSYSLHLLTSCAVCPVLVVLWCGAGVLVVFISYSSHTSSYSSYSSYSVLHVSPGGTVAEYGLASAQLLRLKRAGLYVTGACLV